jgi:hypothetical protein
LGREKRREERKRRRAWQGERREPPSQGTMGGPNRPGQRAQDLQGRLRPPISASVCVSLGLKNPGDFTVAEGHGYPLVMKIAMAQHINTNSKIPIVATCYHDNGLFVN